MTKLNLKLIRRVSNCENIFNECGIKHKLSIKFILSHILINICIWAVRLNSILSNFLYHNDITRNINLFLEFGTIFQKRASIKISNICNIIIYLYIFSYDMHHLLHNNYTYMHICILHILICNMSIYYYKII